MLASWWCIDLARLKPLVGFISICFLFGATHQAFSQQQALLLFGGQDHDKFLGCANCSQYDARSIWNAYGEFGSIYQSTSIWNRYGTFGSPFNGESPWNKYSSTPPVLVDEAGNFYGYFTANAAYDKRATINWLVWILDHYDWVIEHLDTVREKVN